MCIHSLFEYCRPRTFNCQPFFTPFRNNGWTKFGKINYWFLWNSWLLCELCGSIWTANLSFTKHSNFQNLNPVWKKHTINSACLQRWQLNLERRKMQPTRISIFHGHLASAQAMGNKGELDWERRRVCHRIDLQMRLCHQIKAPWPLYPPSPKLDFFFASMTNGHIN